MENKRPLQNRSWLGQKIAGNVGPAAGFSCLALAILATVPFWGCRSGEAKNGLPEIRVQQAEAGPSIDGVLSPGEWGEAVFQLGEAGKSGMVFMKWTDAGLAIALTALDSTPVYGGFEEGKSLHHGDLFEVFIDPAGDHRQYYEVQVDPSGRTHLLNHVLSSDPEVTETLRFTERFLEREKWSYVLSEPEGMKVKSGIGEGGIWTMELLLPAAGFLGRRTGTETLSPTVLRMNFCRVDTRKDGGQEVWAWAKVDPGCQHISPQAMGRVLLLK